MKTEEGIRKMIGKEEIIKLSGIHPLRVFNIYLYGSRVYGTNDQDSDYDILVIGSSLLEHQEFYASTPDGKYNIHTWVPNKFEDGLRRHDIHCLECIYAPDYAKIQIKNPHTDFVLDKNKLKITLLSQSHDSWVKAQMKLRESDIYRGYKSLYHSLRILLFGIQIAKEGKIIDFSAGKNLYNDITTSEKYEWHYFRYKYLPMKQDLEKQFKEG